MAQDHASAGEKMHLGPLGPGLAGAKTHALVKTDRFELIRLILHAGTSLPVHSVRGYISLQCIEGLAVLEVSEAIRLRPGDWVYLDRDEQHGVRAVEDSSLLLTIHFD